MLNKLIFAFCLLFSFNSLANNITHKVGNEVTIVPKFIKISHPFTASGIASLSIKNNIAIDLKILKITSPQARHVDIYEKYTSDIGAIQKKRAKNVLISNKSELDFSPKNKYEVILTGLNRKFLPDEEIQLDFEFENTGKFTVFFEVHPSYK